MSNGFSHSGFVVFYSDKYYKLVWQLEKSSGDIFERRNLSLSIEGKKSFKDIFYGFYSNLPGMEVELFLYNNKGVQGNFLLNAKPQPHFLLFSRGEDPGDYLNQIAFLAKKIDAVKAVIPFNFSKLNTFKNLTYLLI